MLKATQPIGIFDSGIGGLTIAKAISQQLPNENLCYFGDTSHLPYGEKSSAAIQAYSVKIAEMLLQQHCKMIVIACNSASAVAYDLVKEYVDGKAHVVNVVDPVISHLQQHYANNTVGLIGTKPTINSNVYKKKLDALHSEITLFPCATPLLAAAIEEGFASNNVINEILQEYLSHNDLANIDALVLGCTHYPVIMQQISDFYHNTVDIISAPGILADTVKHQLNLYKIANTSTATTRHFYVSDYTTSFVQAAQLFFGTEVNLEHYPLWG